MKRNNRIVIIFTAIFILVISTPGIVSANSAEPPGFTVMVTNPPEDLSVSLLLAGGSQTDAVELRKETKAWEAYFKYFYHMTEFRPDNYEGAVLIVKSGGTSFQCPLPADTLRTYNNLMTLDLKTESLIMGQSSMRVPILVALRVVLTLLIEGIIFLLFGYRTRRSWLTFFIVNIITQGFLNAMITGPVNSAGSMLILVFIILETLIIAAEVTAFLVFLKEHKKVRSFLYSAVANIVSLILGGLLIGYLPI